MRMNIPLDAIDSRTSVRSFSGRGLDSSDRRIIDAAIEESGPCPFGTSPRFALAEPDAVGDVAMGRIGTYGVIKNAPAFVVGAVKPGAFVFADYGYALEGVVLTAAANGLGTCWLGGTFDRSGATDALRLSEGEIVPAITPIGEPAERRTILDRTMRALAGSRKRQPWPSLFFDGTWNAPLSEADAGPWSRALEAVRLGPSASNKQPWRIVRTGGAADPSFHLFLYEDAGYNTAIRGVRIQELDIGIAMRHFEAAAAALGLPGSWRRLEEMPVAFGQPLAYYASWTAR